MMIRSATALRNDYDGMVKLSTEKQEPIYLTRSGDGEMAFLPIALWEKRQAELELFAEILRREQNKQIDLLKQGDPYYNKNLTLSKWNYSLRA